MLQEKDLDCVDSIRTVIGMIVLKLSCEEHTQMTMVLLFILITSTSYVIVDGRLLRGITSWKRFRHALKALRK